MASATAHGRPPALDQVLQALGGHRRVADAGLEQQHDELLAAVASHEVDLGTRLGEQQVGQRLEQPVALRDDRRRR